LLGTLESGDTAVVADMEAGAGTLTRMAEGSLDLAILVVEPTAKSIEVARRSAEIIAERKVGPILVVANKVREPGDASLVGDALGVDEVLLVPEDELVLGAGRDGLSPIDAAPEGPAVRAIAALATRVLELTAPSQIATA